MYGSHAASSLMLIVYPYTLAASSSLAGRGVLTCKSWMLNCQL